MKRKRGTVPLNRKTISRQEIAVLAFCNSKRLPCVIEMDGSRLQWVGIGWVNEGEPQGDEVLVID
jgi:hypothetical protein